MLNKCNINRLIFEEFGDKSPSQDRTIDVLQKHMLKLAKVKHIMQMERNCKTLYTRKYQFFL